MKLTGTPEEISQQVLATWPVSQHAVSLARANTRGGKAQDSILNYQALALFGLARAYSWPNKQILEIGTYYGFSAALMAQAAPMASITTLNPAAWEYEVAAKNLTPFKNVHPLCVASWDWFTSAPALDMVFVDGDHKRVRNDFIYWNKVKPGGLFLFHDYTPNGGVRACPPVYRALNDFKAWLGRDFDVSIIDDAGIGMVGFYKQDDSPDWSVTND